MADIVRNRDLETFLARAEQARADADATPLENVRERCLRSEAAWLDMAAKVQRTEQLRHATLASKESKTA